MLYISDDSWYGNESVHRKIHLNWLISLCVYLRFVTISLKLFCCWCCLFSAFPFLFFFGFSFENEKKNTGFPFAFIRIFSHHFPNSWMQSNFVVVYLFISFFCPGYVFIVFGKGSRTDWHFFLLFVHIYLFFILSVFLLLHGAYKYFI